MKKKICKKCGKKKLLSEFSQVVNHEQNKVYYYKDCKECKKKKREAFKAEHPEEYRAYMQRWRKEHRPVRDSNWRTEYVDQECQGRNCGVIFKSPIHPGTKKPLRHYCDSCRKANNKYYDQECYGSFVNEA